MEPLHSQLAAQQPAASTLPVEGDIAIHEFGRDGQPVEYLEEVYTNLGTPDDPVYFFLSTRHTRMGIDILGDFDPSTVFHSVTREQLEGFIPLFAATYGIPLQPDPSGKVPAGQLCAAYKQLRTKLAGTDLDLALLVALAERAEKDPESISQLLPAAAQVGNSVTEAICLVIDGAIVFSEAIIKMIDAFEAEIEMTSSTASYLNATDYQPQNYAFSTEQNSPDYYLRYGTKGTPMIDATFRITSYYGAQHRSLPGLYITQTGVTVLQAHAGATMSIVGTAVFEPGNGRGTEDNPIAICNGEFKVDYHDAIYACNRHAYLNYTVDAETGYQEREWTPKKKVKATATAANTEPEITEGTIFCRQFKAGDKIAVYIEDEYMNFGTPDDPVLFPVNRTFDVHDPLYANGFFSLQKETLTAFIGQWAQLKGFDADSDTGKAEAARNLSGYVHDRGIDLSLLVAVANSEKTPSLAEIVTVLGDSTDNDGFRANSMLYMLHINHPLVVGSTLTDLVKIFKGVVELADLWIEFVENNQPVIEAPDNFISVLHSDDTDVNHYSEGDYFISDDYILSYWVLNNHHAQITYIVEGHYRSTHPSIPGLFVSECLVRSTWVNVKGAYHVKGTTCFYDEVINMSDDFESFIPRQRGWVQVDYGNNVTKFVSYLNFYADGQKGYYEESFTDGRH